MAQAWNTNLVKEINKYFQTGDLNCTKTALRRGFLCPDGKCGMFKLTRSGEDFVRKYANTK